MTHFDAPVHLADDFDLRVGLLARRRVEREPARRELARRIFLHLLNGMFALQADGKLVDAGTLQEGRRRVVLLLRVRGRVVVTCCRIF